MSEEQRDDKHYDGSHDVMCESVAVDIGVGEMHSPCSCTERWYERELTGLHAEIDRLTTPRSAVARSLTTDQQERGVGAFHQWKANASNPASSAFGGNLHDLARRMFEAMSNADPQERSAEASSRADGEASAAKKPGATASTPCQPGEAETPCGSAPVVQSAIAASSDAVRAIEEHNQGCLAACGKTSTYPHVKESRRCDERRDCPDCPKDWMIEPMERSVHEQPKRGAEGSATLPIGWSAKLISTDPMVYEIETPWGTRVAQRESSMPHILFELVHAAVTSKAVPIEQMVDRFLAWPLPKDFSPDCGIKFSPVNHPNSWPIGTNLLTADQAKAMVLHMLGVTNNSST